MSTTTTTINPGQTAFDVAIAQYGSIEAIGWLLTDNDYSGEFILGAISQEGQVLALREATLNKAVVNYFANRPNTTY